MSKTRLVLSIFGRTYMDNGSDNSTTEKNIQFLCFATSNFKIYLLISNSLKNKCCIENIEIRLLYLLLPQHDQLLEQRFETQRRK